MTYLIENRAAEADMNVMSKTDRAMRILVKLLRNWISFLLRTNIERPLPKRPIRTVMGVTTTSMILAKVNSMVDEVGDLLDLQCHTQKRKHWLSRSHSAILLYLHFTSPPNSVGIETLESYGPYALNFIKAIGRRIMEISGEKRSTSYLMQVCNRYGYSKGE